MNEIYARKDFGGNYQSLLSHLENVGKLAGSFSLFPNTSLLSALIHDLGKATEEFQNYLKEGGERGSVIHSAQGSLYVHSQFDKISLEGSLLKEILEIITAAHHGKLKDGISPTGDSVFFEKMNQWELPKFNFSQMRSNLETHYPSFQQKTQELFRLAEKEVAAVIKQINVGQPSVNSLMFSIGLFTKYLYSCLVDADRLDAYLFESAENFSSPLLEPDKLLTILEQNSITFQNRTDEISTARKNVASECVSAAKLPTGIYTLSVPTGGGKTLSSLKFALNHAKIHEKKRIIYVIPYLSIIEQTADVFKKFLSLTDDSNILLEHHSSIVEDEDDKDHALRKLACSRWDNPIILTTMVQFLETVMSAKGSDLRKFHNMANSVIIFDEIQSLPIHSIHLFNETISFLSKILGSTIILCSATQPLLHMTERHNLSLSEPCQLVKESAKCFDKIKRTKVVAEKSMTRESFADFVLAKAIELGNCLAIVNTKKVAHDVFCRIKAGNSFKDFDILHLSTSMCPSHRRNVLQKIEQNLKEKKPVILISTQLIEAGVDISFSCVVRALAGLDSIVRAAGRCNRSGESQNVKNVYAISILDEKLDKLPIIKLGKEITEKIIVENPDGDYLSSEILDKFYQHYFSNQKNLMDFPVKNFDSIYNMLSLNNCGRSNYENRTGKKLPISICHAFESASENYQVIGNETKSVVVSYGESLALLEKLKTSYSTKEKLTTLKKLEKFSVSLYLKSELKKLWEDGFINVIDEEFGILYLNEMCYSNELGVISPKDLDCIF